MKNLKRLGLFAVAGTLVLSACNKKEFLDETTLTENQTEASSQLNAVYNRTVNYTVVVTNQRESNFRSAEGVAGATVAISVDGTVQTATTDANGQAAFTGLRYGAAAVTVSAPNHTTANFVVDFTAGVDEDVDNHTQRTASTMVTLLPTAGLGEATLTGQLASDRDFTNTGYEVLPDDAGASLFARVNFNNFDANGNSGSIGHNHGGSGRVTDFYYEGLRAATTQQLNDNASRRYSMTLPATAYGLNIQVWSNPYVGTLINFAGDAEPNTTFTQNGSAGTNGVNVLFTGDVFAGETYVRDLFYDAL